MRHSSVQFLKDLMMRFLKGASCAIFWQAITIPEMDDETSVLEKLLLADLAG